jgi:hypothetical protein
LGKKKRRRMPMMQGKPKRWHKSKSRTSSKKWQSNYPKLLRAKEDISTFCLLKKENPFKRMQRRIQPQEKHIRNLLRLKRNLKSL